MDILRQRLNQDTFMGSDRKFSLMSREFCCTYFTPFANYEYFDLHVCSKYIGKFYSCRNVGTNKNCLNLCLQIIQFVSLQFSDLCPNNRPTEKETRHFNCYSLLFKILLVCFTVMSYCVFSITKLLAILDSQQPSSSQHSALPFDMSLV